MHGVIFQGNIFLERCLVILRSTTNRFVVFTLQR